MVDPGAEWSQAGISAPGGSCYDLLRMGPAGGGRRAAESELHEQLARGSVGAGEEDGAAAPEDPTAYGIGASGPGEVERRIRRDLHPQTAPEGAQAVAPSSLCRRAD